MHYYERLCKKYNVTADKEKVENITQYCSRNVREFMEGLRSYASRVWKDFIGDIRKYFEADRDNKRSKVRDLEKYVLKTTKQQSPNMKAVVDRPASYIIFPIFPYFLRSLFVLDT